MLPAPSNSTYLDDCTVGAGKEATGGESEPLPRRMWRATLAMLWRLVLAGLPINIWKCRFLQRQLPLLGMVLCDQ